MTAPASGAGTAAAGVTNTPTHPVRSAKTSALRGTGHRTVVIDRVGEVACDLSSKASARAAIVRRLAVGLGPDGIAVTAVAPGLTDTPAARTVNTDEQFEAAVERQALRRRLTPEDTAAERLLAGHPESRYR